MGYPMTWVRVLSRNSLKVEGLHSSYQYPNDAEMPFEWRINVNIDNPGLLAAERHRELVWASLVDRLKQYQEKARLLIGDMRRLEQDATDEKSICAYIASRIGVDADTVAAVLKEFMTW